ncbi:MAG: transketolase C-terminal domain-containing protein, partial [bacterium]
LYSVKPLDTQTLRLVAEASGNKIITVEDHYPEGGIGEAVKSALANEAIMIKSLAVSKLARSGSPEDLLAFVQIDAQNIVKQVLEAF